MEGGREGGRGLRVERGRDTLEYIYFDHTCAVLKKCNTMPIMTGMDDPTASTMPSTYHSHRLLPNLRFCLNAPQTPSLCGTHLTAGAPPTHATMRYRPSLGLSGLTEVLRVQHQMKLPALGSLALLVLHRPRFSSVGRPQGISWWCSLLGSSTLLLVHCRIHTAIQHQSIFSLQSTVVLGNLQLNKCESALKGLTNLSYSGHAHVFTLNGAQLATS